jgi:hypothetical protein
MEWWEVVGTILGALIVALPGILAQRKVHKLDRARAERIVAEVSDGEVTAAAKLSESAIALVEPMKKRILELDTQLEAVRTRVQTVEGCMRRIRAQNIELYEGVKLLTAQIVSLRQVPVWTPSEDLANMEK